MKAFVSSLAALFLTVAVVGCSDGGGPEPTPTADPAADDMHAAMTAGDEAAAEGHDAAPAEGDAAAPTEGDAPAEGDAAASAEGDAAAPAEGDAAAPAEESKSE